MGLGRVAARHRVDRSIISWLPLFLFVVLFGLSMDYRVFILSRIREAFDRGLTTEEAIRHGIRTTASAVTAAAAVMVALFSIFATLSTVEMKQAGVGLAAAVLIDATVVRAVLLPAAMKLLGSWNWYLPSRLEWLPRVAPEVERARQAAPASTRAAASERGERRVPASTRDSWHPPLTRAPRARARHP